MSKQICPAQSRTDPERAQRGSAVGRRRRPDRFSTGTMVFILFFLVFKADKPFIFNDLYPPILPFSGLTLPFSGRNPQYSLDILMGE